MKTRKLFYTIVLIINFNPLSAQYVFIWSAGLYGEEKTECYSTLEECETARRRKDSQLKGSRSISTRCHYLPNVCSPPTPPKPDPKPEWYCPETRTYYWTKEARDNAKSEYLRVKAAEEKRIAEEEEERRRKEDEKLTKTADDVRAKTGYIPIAPIPELKPEAMPTKRYSNVSSASNTKSIAGTGITPYTPNSKTPKENTVYKSDRGYSLFCGIAADKTGKNCPLSEEEYLYCIVNQLQNHDAPRCQDINRKYQQVWHDIISKDPSYKLYQDFMEDFRDMGIDAANIWVSCGLGIALTPAGEVVIAGPQAAVTKLLKELSRGKPIDDFEMWKEVAKAGALAYTADGLKACIKTGNPMFDAIGKAMVDVEVERFKNKSVTGDKLGEILVVNFGGAALEVALQGKENKIYREPMKAVFKTGALDTSNKKKKHRK